MKTGRLIAGTMIRPIKTFKALALEPRALSKGLRALLFIGVLYTLTVAGLALAGASIFAPPFLRLPADEYYVFEIFFAIPVFLMAWIAAGGLAYLLSRGRGEGRGSYEGLLAALALAVTVPSFVTWIPETILTIALLLGANQGEVMEYTARPGFWQIFVIAYQSAAGAWMLILAGAAVRAVRGVRRARAAVVGLAATLVFLGLMLVFIR